LDSVGKGHHGIHNIEFLVESHPLSWLKKVNSLHHQAVGQFGYDNGDAWILAVEPTSGVVEIASWGNNALGCQFHPEMWTGELGEKFFSIIKKWVNGDITMLGKSKDSFPIRASEEDTEEEDDDEEDGEESEEEEDDGWMDTPVPEIRGFDNNIVASFGIETGTFVTEEPTMRPIRRATAYIPTPIRTEEFIPMPETPEMVEQRENLQRRLRGIQDRAARLRQNGGNF
jgi:hypothetical protein